MGDKEWFTFEGGKECEAALGDLAQATSAPKARTVLRKSMQTVMQPMANHARQLAPVMALPLKIKNKRTGKVTIRPGGRLRKSIIVGGKLNRSQAKGYKKQSDLEVFMGPSGVPEGIAEEFGNYRRGPRPFMRPAWEGGKDKALADFAGVLWNMIKAAADKAARKTSALAK